MRYQSFSLFGPWGANPWAKVHQGEKSWRTPRSTILQSFTAACPPTPEISVTKFLRTKKQTKKQTVTDISTACLSACGDNKQTSTPVVRTRVDPHMPIADRRLPRNTITAFTTLPSQIPATKEPVSLIQQDGKRPDGTTLLPWARGKAHDMGRHSS